MVKKEDVQHRHKITPYSDRSLFGAVERTIVGGWTALLDRTFEKPHQAVLLK